MLQEGAGVQNGLHISPIQVARADKVEFGIDPIETILDVVDSEAVRPLYNRRLDDRLSLRSIKAGLCNMRVISPVRPVHQTEKKSLI